MITKITTAKFIVKEYNLLYKILSQSIILMYACNIYDLSK
jgi:hypothetical protein